MSSDQLNTNVARPLDRPLDSADVWIIEPDLHLGFAGRLREVWRYRRILFFFAVRAVQTLYANTHLGVGWLVLRPLAPVVVGTLVFGRLMQSPSEGVPYFLFFLVGSAAWGFFSEPLLRASRGLEVNRQLLTKLYVPRVILPAGQLAAGLPEPLMLLAIFAVAVWYYRLHDGVWYGIDPLRIPVALLATILAILFAFAMSLWTSVWQARARDVRYVLGYVISFWFFLTPVVYPLSMIPPKLRWLAVLNPMTGLVEAFRWSMLGVGSPNWTAIAVSGGVTAVVLVSGFWYFTASEAGTVDKL